MDGHDELMVMVGEIRADVKTLLRNDAEKGKRIAVLERDSWWAKGALALAAAAFTAKIRALLGI
jgi:hypothetical protein